jgi:hypothetical protein
MGSRWLPESKIILRQSAPRQLAGRVFNILVRIMFNLPYRDTQCGAKILKRKVVDSVINDLRMRGFIFDVELLYAAFKRNFKINEVAITWENKKESKLKIFSDIPKMLVDLLKLRLTKVNP